MLAANKRHFTRKPRIKELSLLRRCYGQSCNERITLKKIDLIINKAKVLYNSLDDDDNSVVDELDDAVLRLYKRKHDILTPDNRINHKIPKIINNHLTIDELEEVNIMQNFRFRNKDQLHRLHIGLKFGEIYRDDVGNVFSGEEILLAGLYRLHSVNILGDEGWMSLFGWRQPRASSACSIFFEFMITNWIGLINDN